MVTQVIILAALGGLAELDRTAVLQSMFSEPIVLAPLIGWFLGVPEIGIHAGILMQLFFLGSVSIGGSSPPDGAMAAIAVMGAIGLSGLEKTVDNGALTAGAILLFMVPASRLGCIIEDWIKNQNVALAHIADDYAGENDTGAIESLVHRRLLTVFALWAGAASITIIAGTLLLNALFAVMPGDSIKALSAAGRLLPLVAAGIALSAIKIRKAGILYAAGCAAMLALSIVIG